MPHTPQSSRCNTQRALRSSNDKDPPRDSRRRASNARILDDVQAAIQATLRVPIECDINEQFVEYHWNMPRDEDYYVLLEDCRKRYYTLRMGPRPCTFKEVLITSGLIAQCAMSDSAAIAGEPKSHRLPTPLSPRANTPLLKSIQNVQVSNKVSSKEPSSSHNIQECLLPSRNKTSELSMARILPTRELRLLALSKKAQIASRAFPYAGTRLNEWKRCLTAVEPADKGLDTNVRSIRRTPVIPWSSLGKAALSTMKQPLERKAVSKNGQQNPTKCSPVTKAALTLPNQMPVVSIQATSSRRNSGKVKPPKPVVPGRCSSKHVVSSKLTMDINTRLTAKHGG
jgi:hypothetical protein